MVLPALGTISYNGYAFGPFSKSRMRADVVPDRGGRTTKWVQYTLDVEDIVFPALVANGTDAEMEVLRMTLTTHCAPLIYQGRGFSDLEVNVAGKAVQDVNYGPKPRMIDMQPLGSNQAWKIHWQVTTCIPECSNAVYKGRPLDYSYEVSFSLDNGYSVRTINGYLEIPATRLNGARVPPDQADAYWDKIYNTFPTLVNFKRGPVERKLSADKRVLTFTIRDREEHPNYFVEGMESWDGDHEVMTELQHGMGFVTYANTLSATMRVQKDQPKSLAWKKFGMILMDRISGNVGAKRTIPMSLRVRDRLSSQETSFTFTYNRLKSDIAKFLSDNRVWQPLSAVNWQQWNKAASGGINNARGYAQLVYNTQWDAIVDLCAQTTAPPQGIAGFGKLQPIAKVDGYSASRLPDPADSFLDFKCSMAFMGTAKQARHKPLADPFTPQFGNIKGGGGQSSVPQQEVSITDTNLKTRFGQGTAPPDVIQQVGAAAGRLIIFGEAIRAGYAVNAPRILSVGNKPVFIDSEFFECHELGNAGGLPIFGGRWAISYLVSEIPSSNIPIPNNPISGADSVTSVQRF